MAEDQRQKSKVIGKRRQEVFSGRFKKTQQGGKPGQQGESLEHFQVLAVGPGNSWQSWGLEEGFDMVYSADFVALAETLDVG